MSERRSLTLYAIAPTQFTADGRHVDRVAMAENMERMAGLGITRVLITGAYGEFTALSDDERVGVLEAVRATGACEAIMACAASTSTEATSRLACTMLARGATTAMVSAPLATETTEADVFRHFEQLATTVGSNLVIYNNPVFGHDLSPRQLAAIVDDGAYVAIKQGTRDSARLLAGVESVRRCQRDVSVLIASDVTAAMTLTAPVDGLTSTNSWVFPRAIQSLVRAAERGDVDSLQATHRALGPYRDAVTGIGQPAAVKAAMQLRGYSGSVAVRGPYAACTTEQIDVLRRALAECDAALEAATPYEEART